jgi:hypothetical protein
MSLHTLANQLQSAGRGQDKMLVHMTPGEVGGLQALAMAHGGSLSINPQTGLPEAGILGKLLPTVLGFALGPAGMGIQIGGLSSAASAGLISGAVGTLTTGSLSKGIMAGLGAYGGASLGGALKGLGGGEFAPMAGSTVAERTAAMAPPSLANAAVTPKIPPGLLAATDPAMRGMTSVAPPVGAAPGSTIFKTPSAEGFRVKPPPMPLPEPIAPKVSDIKLSPAGGGTFGENMSAAGRGAAKVFESPESLFAFAKENPAALAAIAASSSSDILAGPPKEREKSKGLEKYRYVYDRQPVGVPAFSSAERDYFPRARYESTGEYYAAGGGLMALANGGTVEDMSRLNAIGANTGYPMANQMSSGYSTAAERPISENIIRPQGEANVDPYTGEQKFADGGYTRYTGTRPLDQYKDDYYYVTGSMGGPGYYMYRPPSGTDTNDAGGASSFFDPNYFNPKTGTFGAPVSSTAPKLGTEAVEQTKETLNPMYQKYFGRDIDPSGLATYAGRSLSEEELDKIFTGSEEYKPIAAAKAAAAKEASYATPEQAADIYERVMGRQPDIGGLKYYSKTNRMTPEEMEKSLRGSDEYFYNLTKPFVPAITYGAGNIASIEGAPYYDPTQYGFPSSQTNARNEIKGMYQNQLGRIADPRGEQYWADTIGADNRLSRQDRKRFQVEAEKEMQARQAGYAGGGLSDLGAYSDGGRLLKGPGDGVSDSIPAVIGERQPARLARNEFVIPARIVSEIGNGSTDAGAQKLYQMMERVQRRRAKTVGKKNVAVDSKAYRELNGL